MYKQHAKRKPDFYAVLVLLVLLCFGLTVTVQLMSFQTASVAVSQPADQPVKTVQVRS
jgi:hypothetical protein